MVTVPTAGRAFLRSVVQVPGTSRTRTEIRTSLPVVVVTTVPQVEGALLVDPDHDLVIYGDTVRVHQIAMRLGRHIKIVARTIDTYGGLPANIEVVGADGFSLTGQKRPPGEPVKPGKNGSVDLGQLKAFDAEDGPNGNPGTPGREGGAAGPGGTIELLATRLVGPFTLTVRGGDGGGGEDGGDGGNGGNGGEGTYNNSVSIITGLSTWTAKPGKPGTGGNGGPGGVGGNGGRGGSIVVRHLEPLDEARLTLDVRGGKAGNNGADGQPGRGGWTPGLSNWFGQPFTLNPPQIPEAHGAAGVVVPCTASGQPGGEGTTHVAASSAADLLQGLDVTHCEMLVQRLHGQYVVAGFGAPDHLDLMNLLGWCARLLAEVDSVTAVGDRRRLDALRVQVATMSARMQSGKDAFGFARDVVPTPSFRTYLEYLDKHLPRLQAVEADFERLAGALAANLDLRANLSAADTGRLTMQSALKQDLVRLRGELTAQLAEIRKATVASEAARVACMRRQHELVEAVRSSFNWDIKEFFSAMEMVVFVPPTPAHGVAGVAMAALQGGKLIQHGMSTVTQNDGTVVEKDYIIHQVRTAEVGLQSSLDSALKSYSGDDSVKVLVEARAFEEHIGKLFNFVQARDLHYVLQGLIRCFERRSALVYQYNGTLYQYRDAQTQLAATEEEAASAIAAFTRVSDPSMPAVVTFLGRLLDRMKLDLLRQVAMAARAYQMVTLDTTFDAFSALRSNGVPRELGSIGATAILACMDDIDAAFLKHLETQSNDHQPFGGEDERFRLVVTSPEALRLLRDSRELSIAIGWLPPKTPPGWTWDGEARVHSCDGVYFMSGLGMAADVRLTELRVFVHGARVTEGDPKVTVAIEHGFDDRFYSADRGREYLFGHNAPPRYVFGYNAETRAIAIRATISTDAVSPSRDREARFAGVGPFTTWRISLPAHFHTADGTEIPVNDHLDLSGITAVEIQLSGYLKPMPSASGAERLIRPTMTPQELTDV